MEFKGTHWTKLPNRDEILSRINFGKKGRKQSKETVEKRASKVRGRKQSSEEIEKRRIKLKGRIFTEEWKRKIGLAQIGRKRSESTKLKMSLSAKREELSRNWVGDSVKYNGLHAWIRRQLGDPETCEFCKKSGLTGKKIHWANKSHEYKRDINDWIRLCATCHYKYDNRSSNIKRNLYGRFTSHSKD